MIELKDLLQEWKAMPAVLGEGTDDIIGGSSGVRHGGMSENACEWRCSNRSDQKKHLANHLVYKLMFTRLDSSNPYQWNEGKQSETR